MSTINVAVIIPAAGASQRFGEQDKIEQDIAGRAVFIRAIELFAKRESVDQIIVAVNPDTITEFKFKWGDKLGFHGAKLVAGGKAERWETVMNALDAVNDNVTHIAVHDAARPLTTSQLIENLLDAAATYDAVVPAMPVTGTLKRVTDVGEDEKPAEDPLDAILGGETGKATKNVKRIAETVTRTDLVEVQTPQLFKRDLLLRAYDAVKSGDLDAANITDDAGLVEALGEPVYVVDGESTNLKITHPGDIQLARAIHGVISKREAKADARRKFLGN